jgi:SAM-dependent methyltransferase
MQLAYGRRIIQESGLTGRVELVQADFARLPLVSKSVDAVFAVEAMCHAENKPAFMREVARVLKPGGRVVIVDYFLTARPLSWRERRLLARFMRGWTLSRLLTLAEWRELAHRAGLEYVDFEDVTRLVLPDSRRMARLCALSLPRTWYRVRRGTRSPAVLGNRLSGFHQYRLLTSGVYRHGIFAARSASRPHSSRSLAVAESR